MAKVIVKNLTGGDIGLPAPFWGVLATSATRTFDNIDVNEVQNSPPLRKLLERQWLGLTWVNSQVSNQLGTGVVTPNVITKITTPSGQPLTFLRQNHDYWIHCNCNLYLSGPLDTVVMIGGVEVQFVLPSPPSQANSVLEIDTTGVPTGLSTLELFVGGQLRAALLVVVQPPTTLITEPA